MNARLLFALAAGSAAAFVCMARAVARRETAPLDAKVHERTAVEPGDPVREAAEQAGPIGKWWTYLPAAVVTAGFVAARRGDSAEIRSRLAGAAAIVMGACAAPAISDLLDELPQPPAPPGRPTPDHPVFPSGHAFGTSVVGLTAAYVIAREELAPATVAFPVALVVPVATSLGRLMEEKHWISDIAGGHLAALTLASFAAALYEGARE